MLLKDCPVGSMVRLSHFLGREVKPEPLSCWHGMFEVLNAGEENYIIDAEGTDRSSVVNDPDYQFEIISTNMELTICGITYNLTPVMKRRTITIDGIEYEMEEVK